MALITWGVDGHGQQWPWCVDCGQLFGPVRPSEVNHSCPDRLPVHRPPAPLNARVDSLSCFVSYDVDLLRRKFPQFGFSLEQKGPIKVNMVKVAGTYEEMDDSLQAVYQFTHENFAE